MDDIANEQYPEGLLDDDSQDLALLDGPPTPPPEKRTLVVVLAAGAGSRYSGDTHKLEAVIRDRTVAEHSIVAAMASGVGDVIVITGASQPDAETMRALSRASTLDDRPVSDRPVSDRPVSDGPVSDSAINNSVIDDIAAETIQFIYNADWAEGQAVSLQVALGEASRVGADAIVVGLGDQPGVTPEAWRRIAASQSQVAVATYDGVRGNPVRLHHSIWHMLPTTGDEGARSLMRLHPELVEQIPCPGSAHDIDTREDLQLWQSRSSTSSP